MKKLFSGEVFFALFLFSGLFKESINFIPVDLAGLFLALTILSVIKRFYKNPTIYKNSITPILLFFALTVLIFTSFFYSPNLELTQGKIIKFVLLTTPAFIIPFLLFKTKDSLVRFLMTLAFTSTTMALFSLPMIFGRGSSIGFVGFNGGNYLGLARACGVGISILLFLGLLNKKLKRYRLVFLLAIVATTISLLSSGARMPIIALSAALLIAVIYPIKFKKGVISYPKYYNKVMGVLAILLIPLAIAYQQGYFNSVIFRFSVLVESGGGNSVQARIDRFSAAIEMWQNNFILGNGFGSFGEYYTSGVVSDYPHNLFLELLSELGVVGFFIFLALLIVAFMRSYSLLKIKNIRTDNLFITVITIFMIIFLSAMVSGNINENRIMLTFLSIICLLPMIFSKEKEVNQLL